MKKLVVIILLVVVIGGYVAYKSTSTPPKEYITITPNKGDVIETVTATGSLVGRTEVSVGAQVTGQVQKLHVELGDKVKKGQLIAEIDPRTQNNAVKNAEAELKIAQAGLKQQKALLKKLQAEYDRQIKMKGQDATSIADLESATADLEQTKAAIAVSEAEIRKAEVSVDNARTNLGYTRITAPQDGVIIAIVTDEGQTVVSNQSAPTIVKLADLDTMTVEAEISEADVVKVKPNMESYFTILGLPDRKFEATLRQVEPAPDSIAKETSSSASSSSTSSEAIYYNALLDVPNLDGVLRVSMTAEVTIVLGASKDVMTLPISAMRDKVGPNQYKVLVLGPDHSPVEKVLTVGRRDNLNYEIKSGLSATDRIILGSDIETAENAAMKSRRGPGHPPM